MQQVPILAEWIRQTWIYLTGLWRFLLDSSATTVLLSLLSLALLHRGLLLSRIHRLYILAMAYLLRVQPSKFRSYERSLLSAVERPSISFCLISFVCHSFKLVSSRLASAQVAQLVAQYTDMVLRLSVNVCSGAAVMSAVNILIMRFSRGVAKKSDIIDAETSRQESQVRAVGQTARILVFLFTFLASLPIFNVNLTTVVSFCGIGGLVLSLVSKGVFVNLIGSLTLYLTQPFTLGDWIQTLDGKVDGWVQSMGPYHTQVMRWDRRPLYIPNSKFIQSQIINATRMTHRRILLEIPVRLADLEKVDGILKDIRDLIENHRKVDVEMHRLAHLREIGNHAAMIWVSCYTVSINLKEWLEAKQDVLLGIVNIMFKHGTVPASSLERQFLRVDSTGAFLTGAVESLTNVTPTPVTSTTPTPENPPTLLEMSKEVEHLKRTQEKLFKRERDLKQLEKEVSLEQQMWENKQSETALQRVEVEEWSMTLDKELAWIASKEEGLQSHEEEIDAEMEDLQKLEEELDAKLSGRYKEQASGTQEKFEEIGKARIENQQKRERDLKAWKAEMAQYSELEAPTEVDTQSDPSDNDKDEDSDSDEPIEDERTRIQRIAESIGGE